MKMAMCMYFEIHMVSFLFFVKLSCGLYDFEQNLQPTNIYLILLATNLIAGMHFWLWNKKSLQIKSLLEFHD